MTGPQKVQIYGLSAMVAMLTWHVLFGPLRDEESPVLVPAFLALWFGWGWVLVQVASCLPEASREGGVGRVLVVLFWASQAFVLTPVVVFIGEVIGQTTGLIGPMKASPFVGLCSEYGWMLLFGVLLAMAMTRTTLGSADRKHAS